MFHWLNKPWVFPLTAKCGGTDLCSVVLACPTWVEKQGRVLSLTVQSLHIPEGFTQCGTAASDILSYACTGRCKVKLTKGGGSGPDLTAEGNSGFVSQTPDRDAKHSL